MEERIVQYVSRILKGMEYVIRRAGVADAEVIAHHRAAMFEDMGLTPPEESALLRQASVPWMADMLTNAGYVGWLVENGASVVAGGGVLVREIGPIPGCYRVGRWGHIVNVYTDPRHRRRGLARRIMVQILAWCGEERFDHVTLSASDEGRPLYESLGFRATADMKLVRKL
jgi:GNAT superfamily N-acetyltransferase